MLLDTPILHYGWQYQFYTTLPDNEHNSVSDTDCTRFHNAANRIANFRFKSQFSIGRKQPPDGIISNMATTKESNLSALYVELNRFAQNGEYERALKTANKSNVNSTIFK